MKAEISPGVKIVITKNEKQLLTELAKTGELAYNNLRAEQICVILNLLDKAVIKYKKKGPNVYYKLRPGISFSAD